MRVWRLTTGSTFIRSGIELRHVKCGTSTRRAKRREDACALRKLARNETSATWISHEVLWSAMRPRIAFADQLGKLLSDAGRINQQMGNSRADPPLRSDVPGG